MSVPTRSAVTHFVPCGPHCRIRSLRIPSLHQAQHRTPRHQRPSIPSWPSPSPLSFSSRASFSQTSSPHRSSDAASPSPSPYPSSPGNPASDILPKTHYDLFPQTIPQGPPPSSPFHIDTRLLRREFLSLQAKYHPDLHPPSSKARAEATSSLINEAYKTLLNPLLRAQYLLSLRGVNVSDDETLKIEEPDLLMEVLEAREEIEEAEQESDLERPRQVNEERIRLSEEVLSQTFRDDDVDAAKREAVRLRYWVNVRESLDNWERGKPIVLEH